MFQFLLNKIKNKMFILFSIFRNKAGVATLPAILTVTAVLVEVGIIIGFSSYYINTSIQLTRLSNSAIYAANAGINDAVLRLTRNKNLNESYNLSAAPGATAAISIIKDSPQVGKTKITSAGNSGLITKTIEAVVNIDSLDLKTTIESWNEI